MTNPADLAREISFAVFRVAKLIEQPKLKSALESAAVDLVTECGTIPYLSYVPKGIRLPYLPYIEKLNELIRLAEAVGEIKPINSHVLQRELQALYFAIATAVNNKEEPNLAEFFAEKAKLPAISQPAPFLTIKREKSNSIVLRQSAILIFIRELPNGCRMRDLLTKFPEVSERTLRNDLQDLNSEGLVERLGKRAHSSFRAVTKQEIIAL